MDPVQTVKLCEDWLESDYEKIARVLLEQKKALAFSFINTVIKTHEASIIHDYNNSVMAVKTDFGSSERFIPILLIFVELLCEKKFRSKIVDFV